MVNYLTEKWDLKVTLLDTFDKVDAHKIDLNVKTKSRFALANMMSLGFKKKNRFINLLTGKFARTLPLNFPFTLSLFRCKNCGRKRLACYLSSRGENFY